MAKTVSAHQRKSQAGGFVFEVNPLVLQIVLYNEAEILQRRPEFRSIDHPNRVAEICKEVFFSDVAGDEFQSTPAWVPTGEIERECGGRTYSPARATS